MIERCGIIVDNEYIEYDNISTNDNEFQLPLEALMRDDIDAIWHTHPDGDPYLSSWDRVNQIATDKDWVVVTDKPHRYEVVPLLIGREFEYGKADCGTIVEDSYMLCGINLGFTERNDISEDVKSGYILDSLYRAGFYDVDEMQAGDVIVNNYNNSAEHMMLYLGNDEVIHHLYNRKSRVEFLNSFYRKKISKILRHRDWKPGMIKAIKNDIEASKWLELH